MSKVNGSHYVVTNNGVEVSIYNGIPDFLYEGKINRINTSTKPSKNNFSIYSKE